MKTNSQKYYQGTQTLTSSKLILGNCQTKYNFKKTINGKNAQSQIKLQNLG